MQGNGWRVHAGDKVLDLINSFVKGLCFRGWAAAASTPHPSLLGSPVSAEELLNLLQDHHPSHRAALPPKTCISSLFAFLSFVFILFSFPLCPSFPLAVGSGSSYYFATSKEGMLTLPSAWGS